MEKHTKINHDEPCLICPKCLRCITCNHCQEWGCGKDLDYDGDYIG